MRRFVVSFWPRLVDAYEKPEEEVVDAGDELRREAADVINLALAGTVVSRRRRAA